MTCCCPECYSNIYHGECCECYQTEPICCYCEKNCTQKGLFTIAWSAETPCCNPGRACGIELELCDTPSNIEQKCQELKEWLNCPPINDMCECKLKVNEFNCPNIVKQLNCPQCKRYESSTTENASGDRDDDYSVASPETVKETRQFLNITSNVEFIGENATSDEDRREEKLISECELTDNQIEDQNDYQNNGKDDKQNYTRNGDDNNGKDNHNYIRNEDDQNTAKDDKQDLLDKIMAATKKLLEAQILFKSPEGEVEKIMTGKRVSRKSKAYENKKLESIAIANRYHRPSQALKPGFGGKKSVVEESDKEQKEKLLNKILKATKDLLSSHLNCPKMSMEKIMQDSKSCLKICFKQEKPPQTVNKSKSENSLNETRNNITILFTCPCECATDQRKIQFNGQKFDLKADNFQTINEDVKECEGNNRNVPVNSLCVMGAPKLPKNLDKITINPLNGEPINKDKIVLLVSCPCENMPDKNKYNVDNKDVYKIEEFAVAKKDEIADSKVDKTNTVFEDQQEYQTRGQDEENNQELNQNQAQEEENNREENQQQAQEEENNREENQKQAQEEENNREENQNQLQEKENNQTQNSFPMLADDPSEVKNPEYKKEKTSSSSVDSELVRLKKHEKMDPKVLRQRIRQANAKRKEDIKAAAETLDRMESEKELANHMGNT
ncbi:unnamed protein product [Brassicogethes aeneus]|uniref:Uncharacterized protein n=1 Tax=Brassicogethes aeneus TaxID=1431903 RepID=A0A9P0BG35_BRAAE|nr:unnamed protein product [Brassicogethes aeneus]